MTENQIFLYSGFNPIMMMMMTTIDGSVSSHSRRLRDDEYKWL